MTKPLRPPHPGPHRSLFLISALLSMVSGSTATQPLFAQSTSHQTHELHLYPGVPSVRLSLWQRPLATGSAVPDALSSPPSFGRLQGGAYAPGDEFWQVGADRLTLRETEGGPGGDGQLVDHTFLLSLWDVQQRAAETEDFESTPTWETQGDSGLLEVVNGHGNGHRSLRATVVPGASAWITHPPFNHPVGDPGALGGGVAGLGGAGGTMIEPPPGDIPIGNPIGNPIEGSSPPETMVIATLGEVQVQVGVVNDGFQDIYRMRAVAPAHLCEVCETSWQPIPISHPVDFRLRAGREALRQNDAPNDMPWSLRFDVTPAGGPTQTDWLSGDFYMESDSPWRVGILESTGGLDGVTVYFDDLKIWQDSDLFGEKGHRAQTFEQAEIGDWQTYGSAGTLSPSGISGDWGWQIDADALSGSGDDSLLVDTGPSANLAGTGIKNAAALLRVDLSGLDLAVGDSIQLLRASSFDSLDGGFHLSVNLQRWNGGLRVRVRARDDQGVTQKAPWYPLIGDGPFDLAVRLQAATGPGENNGEIHLWVDGRPAGSRTDIDDDQKTLEAFAFGAHRSTLVGHASPDYGTFILDDLATFPEPE